MLFCCTNEIVTNRAQMNFYIFSCWVFLQTNANSANFRSTQPSNFSNKITSTVALKLLKLNFLANGCLKSYGPYNIECLNSIWRDIGCAEDGGLYPERLSVTHARAFNSRTI